MSNNMACREESMSHRCTTLRELCNNELVLDLLFKFMGSFLKLLDVSMFWRRLKPLKYYWKLNHEYSLKFCFDDEFHHRITQRFTDINKQVSLNLYIHYS